MSDTNAQEPTMEEILASIRRIISEDDAPPAASDETPYAATESAAPVVHEPAPHEPASSGFVDPPMSEEEDVLELTQPLPPPPPAPAKPLAVVPSEPAPTPTFASSGRETLGDLDLSPPKPQPPAPPLAAAPPPRSDAPLISGQAASAAASSFSQLSRSIARPADGKTLEDVVTALIRPMLKDWLDQNLPSVVERQVQAEVERISRNQGA